MYRQVEKHIDIAEELNIPVGTLQKWVGQDRQFRDEAYGGGGGITERILQVAEFERFGKI